MAQIEEAETAAELIAALDRGLDCKHASDSTMRKWKKAALARCEELGMDPTNLRTKNDGEDCLKTPDGLDV